MRASNTRFDTGAKMGAIERMEALVRQYCSRRDQRNVHNLAEDIRMISLETLLSNDFKKHVHLNRARLDSCFNHTTKIQRNDPAGEGKKERNFGRRWRGLGRGGNWGDGQGERPTLKNFEHTLHRPNTKNTQN